MGNNISTVNKNTSILDTNMTNNNINESLLKNNTIELKRHNLLIALNKLNNLQFNILDIQDRCGSTGYIDFITNKELNNNNVMQGIDSSNRSFFVLKAEIVYSNNTKIKTLTTFFQRYTSDNILWHAAGNYMPILFCTVGGASVDQINMLYELLVNNNYIFIDKNYKDLRIYNSYLDDFVDYNPVSISLGYSS